MAPDSFKGTFTAAQVSDALARGLQEAGVSVDRCPVADGGEGTLDALIGATGGELVAATATDPLGRAIHANFGRLGDTAVVEMAAASGLALLDPEERDPWSASTYGTGELIAAAVQQGAREVLVTVGGSATVDGGRGALAAIAAGGGLHGVPLVVLCDVTTPWERCAAVYGPQKGAGPAMVLRLAARLDALASQLPRDPRGIPGSGAAGGLAGALWAAHGADLRPGAPHVLDRVGFDARMRACDVVICGEGRIDGQSLEGKIVAEIAARARTAGIALHAVVGCDQLPAADREALGLRSVTEATSLEELELAGARIGHRLRPVAG